MKLWTYAEIKQKVQSDLDLQEETFITPDEMVGYCNEAIHEAESEILTIYEDYFLSSTPLTLTTGVSLYSLPSNIYAQKIRGLVYSNGSVQYTIRKIRGSFKFEDLQMIQTYSPNDDYRYLLTNSTAGVQSKILLAPPSRETGAYVTVWYIRNAQRILTAAESGILPTDANTAGQLATILDIPEFSTFIIDFMKCKCLAKDNDGRLDDQIAALAKQREMLVSTLTNQVPDDDNRIQMDLSFYSESS